MTKIIDLEVYDVRFPTSSRLDGSDAMNADPDYSAAYVKLHTDCAGLESYGLTFTIGRGNELCCAAIESFKPMILGCSMEEIISNMESFWNKVVGDS